MRPRAPPHLGYRGRDPPPVLVGSGSPPTMEQSPPPAINGCTERLEPAWGGGGGAAAVGGVKGVLTPVSVGVTAWGGSGHLGGGESCGAELWGQSQVPHGHPPRRRGEWSLPAPFAPPTPLPSGEEWSLPPPPPPTPCWAPPPPPRRLVGAASLWRFISGVRGSGGAARGAGSGFAAGSASGGDRHRAAAGTAGGGDRGVDGGDRGLGGDPFPLPRAGGSALCAGGGPRFLGPRWDAGSRRRQGRRGLGAVPGPGSAAAGVGGGTTTTTHTRCPLGVLRSVLGGSYRESGVRSRYRLPGDSGPGEPRLSRGAGSPEGIFPREAAGGPRVGGGCPSCPLPLGFTGGNRGTGSPRQPSLRLRGFPARARGQEQRLIPVASSRSHLHADPHRHPGV